MDSADNRLVLISLLALAFAPGALLLLFFYLRDKYRKESWFPLTVSLLLGAIAIVPSASCSAMLQRWTGWRPDMPDLAGLFVGSLLIVGLVEESWKFLVVRLYAYRTRDFDEPYDGIMYSVVAALGFATLENVYYVLSRGVGTGLLRAVLAVPGHALYGVLMGYFIGAAKFSRSDSEACLLSLAGLGAAVLAAGFELTALYRVHPGTALEKLAKRYLAGWLFRFLGIDYATGIVAVGRK